MAKVFTLLQRKEGWSCAEFSDYWATTHKDHALDLANAGFFSGYVQNHLITGLESSVWPAADGVPEIWVPSIDSLTDLVASEVYQKGAGRDEANFTSGLIDSYVSIDCSEAGLAAMSTSGIRHLLFLHLDLQGQTEQVEDCLDQCDQGLAFNVFQVISAVDASARCMVFSGFWESIVSAKRGVSEMAMLLQELPGVRPVNAGVYEARTIVKP